MKRGAELEYMMSWVKPKPKSPIEISKIQLTPNISKLILKKVANAILDSMEVVPSPNSTICKK